jgi:hypothetical protein
MINQNLLMNSEKKWHRWASDKNKVFIFIDIKAQMFFFLFA